MGGLATHPAWESIAKLEEWFGNKNLDVHVRRDGPAIVTVKSIGVTFKFYPDGTGVVEHEARGGGVRQLVVGGMNKPPSLPHVMGSIAKEQSDPSPFVGEVRAEVSRSTGVLPLVIPVANSSVDAACELLSFVGLAPLWVTVNRWDDGTHGGKIRRGRWPDAMTIHFHTMSCGAIRDALEVMDV